MTQKPAPPALASATLAQVYIQQDHLEQARRMLARVLHADPFHGHALALAERLTARSRARLYAGVRPGRGLAVRWHDAPTPPEDSGDPPLHLVLAVFRKVGDGATTSADGAAGRSDGAAGRSDGAAGRSDGAVSVYVTSAPCPAPAGEHHFTGAAASAGPATASLCLARWDGQRLQPVAVHEPLSW
jgi:hypothetical protein